MDINYRPEVNLRARAASGLAVLGSFHPKPECACPLCNEELHKEHHHKQPEYIPSLGKRVWYLRLRPHDHEPVSLALTIASGFQRGPDGPTADQIQASNAWKQLWPEFPSNRFLTHPSAAEERLVISAFNFFNETFFCKKLERVDIEWRPFLPNGAIGHCTQGKMGRVNRHTVIRLTYGLYREQLIGTLLHEMVHALFRQYACDKPNCVCRAIYSSEMDRLGHGRAFTRLAAAIRHSSEAFLGFTAEVFSPGYMARLILRTGCHPSDHDLLVCMPKLQCRRHLLNSKEWKEYRTAKRTHRENERRVWADYRATEASTSEPMQIDSANCECTIGAEEPMDTDAEPPSSGVL